MIELQNATAETNES